MFRSRILHGIACLTLFFFVFFILSTDFTRAQSKEDDTLSKAKNLYLKGNYEESIGLLSSMIKKAKNTAEQKKSTAEAYYWLAKNYFDMAENTKVDENLQKVYETYPTFAKDDNNLLFKQRMEKTRKQILGENAGPMPTEAIYTSDSQTDAQQVIQQPGKGKKKSSGWLIVGGVVVVGAVLALLLAKKKETVTYDIRGTWRVDGLLHTGQLVSSTYTFSGSITEGTFVDNLGLTGTYIVSEENVNFKYDAASLVSLSFAGTFKTQEEMSGLMTYIYVGDNLSHTGQWTASRTTASALQTGTGVSVSSVFATPNPNGK
ncbi:MAG: tetratricopeptide repeat protein [Candidatus Omnitrophota bacterium]